jgi:tetratricopeptide (TPR) repeat protein
MKMTGRTILLAALLGTLSAGWGGIYEAEAEDNSIRRGKRGCGGDPIDRDYYVDVLDPRALVGKGWELFQLRKTLDLMGDGQIIYAYQQLKYILCRYPNMPKGLKLLENVAASQKAPTLPIPYYEYALSLYPQHAETHALYGFYLVEIGEIDKGIAELTRATAVNPKYLPAFVKLASAYYDKGDKTLGDQAAQRARELGYEGKIPEEKIPEKSPGKKR